MTRYYMSQRPKLSWLNVAGMLGVFTIALGVVAYVSATGYPGWQSKWIVLLIATALTGFSLAEQRWPVVSIDADRIVIHRFCGIPRAIRYAEVETLKGTGAILTLMTRSRNAIALNLLQLSKADRELVRSEIVERISELG